MVVLGIDPGSSQTGFGIVSSHRRALQYVGHGVIRAASRLPLPQRLQAIYRGIHDVIDAHRPNGMAVEAIFHARNAKSSLVLGHARGIALLAAVERSLDIYEYSPRQVKQALTGYGNAPKEQLRAMVRALLALQGAVPLDASDALAVAICHAHCHQTEQRLDFCK
jgi:crossover junction endodeoxyribonuclease RuvC